MLCHVQNTRGSWHLPVNSRCPIFCFLFSSFALIPFYWLLLISFHFFCTCLEMITIKVFAILLPMKIFMKTCVPLAKIFQLRSVLICYFQFSNLVVLYFCLCSIHSIVFLNFWNLEWYWTLFPVFQLIIELLILVPVSSYCACGQEGFLNLWTDRNGKELHWRAEHDQEQLHRATVQVPVRRRKEIYFLWNWGW